MVRRHTQNASLAARLHDAALRTAFALGAPAVLPPSGARSAPALDIEADLDRELSVRACSWPAGAFRGLTAAGWSASRLNPPSAGCPRCARPVARRRWVSVLFPGIARVTVSCPRCGILLDGPDTWPESTEGFSAVTDSGSIVSSLGRGWLSARYADQPPATTNGLELNVGRPENDCWLTVAVADRGDFAIQRLRGLGRAG